MSDLNKKQFEAVETVNGPVVIIAGPGTGKTKTLVERTVNILETTGRVSHGFPAGHGLPA